MTPFVIPKGQDAGPDGKPSGTGRFVRNSIFGTIAGGSSAVGNVLGSIIVAHSLGVEGTGVVAFALFIVMAAATVADFGVQSSLARYLPELIAAGLQHEAECLTTALLRALLLPCIAVMAGLVAYGVWDWHAGGAAPEQAAIWSMVGIACMLRTLTGFSIGYLRGMQRFDSLALVIAISFAALVAGVAIGSMNFGVVGALAGYCLGAAPPAALCFRHIRILRPPPREIWLRVRRYAIYSWAGSLVSAFVWSRAEVFFLERSCGSTAVGLFSIGVTLANMASQGPMLLTSALLPYFAENFRQGTLGGLQGNCAAAMRVIGFLVFPACFGTAAVLPVLLPLLFGQAFADAVPAATVLVLAGALGGTASVGTSLIMATDHSDFIFFSGTAAAMLMVAAGFSLIPMFGVMGAAWVRATIQLLMVAVSGWFITRRLQLSLPLFDLGKLLIAAALCGSAARACLWWVPGAGSLPLAIFVGSAVYIVSVRLMHGLPKNDADWLRSVCRRLPAWSHNAVDLGFRVIVPNVSAAAPDIRSARNAN